MLQSLDFIHHCLQSVNFDFDECDVIHHTSKTYKPPTPNAISQFDSTLSQLKETYTEAVTLHCWI